MYPPREDFIKKSAGGGLMARTKGNNINLGADGSISILDLSGKTIYYRAGGR
jgi:hypothetical protein